MLNGFSGFDARDDRHNQRGRSYIFILAILLTLLVITYGNSLQGEWQFDDRPNIVENSNIQLRELSWHGVKQTFFFQNRFQRPLSYLSFALNYRFGGLDVFGYHVVNLIIHLISSFFFFLFTFHTLLFLKQGDQTAERARNTALLATVLWMISPLQVLAVSYIVQRMASLAGMFFIMAMFFYLQGRTSPAALKRGVYYTLFTAAALASFGSKENAAMLPVTVFFYDLFLIQGVSRENVMRSLKLAVIPTAIVVMLAMFYTDFSAITEGFAQRGFTAGERLLTECRVMMFYLSLLIYPLGDRLALLHDIDVSLSLLHPWTTLPAILLIVLLIGYALWVATGRRVVSFCIIAFFLNHAIEGSVIPLELIYEHRNYVPSMFFFMVLSLSLIRMLDWLSYRKALQYLTAMVVVCFLIVEGFTVYQRNEILRFEKTFWLDNVSKAPNLSRPHSYLGKVFLREENYAAALYEYGEALRIARYGNMSQPAFDLCVLGNYYLTIADDADRAIGLYNYAMAHYGVMPEIYNGMAVALLRKGDLAHARINILKALSYRDGNASYHNNLAMILLKEGHIDQAAEEANRALLLQASYAPPLAVLGEVYRVRGDYLKSIQYWERYLQGEKQDINAYLALLELYEKIGDNTRTIRTIEQIFCKKSGKRIGDVIGYLNRRSNLLAYVARKERLEAIIKKYIVDL